VDLGEWIEHIFEKVVEHFSSPPPPEPIVVAPPPVPPVVEEKPMPVPEIPKPTGLSDEQLKKIMPLLSVAKRTLYLPLLNAAMEEFLIDSPLRIAAFVAQLSHESAQLRYFEEIASGAAYEGRKDLGNVFPGDGKLYKGRGPIQLTGRSNYRDAGKDLGLELEANPILAAAPEVGFRTAGWFWKRKALNALADAGEFKAITKKVNGGYNGLEDRIKYYTVAKGVLGIT